MPALLINTATSGSFVYWSEKLNRKKLRLTEGHATNTHLVQTWKSNKERYNTATQNTVNVKMNVDQDLPAVF